MPRTLLALLLALALLAAGCGGDDTADEAPAETVAAQPEFAQAATAAVKAVGAGDATLVDVRTQEEWDAGHAVPATWFPLTRLEEGELPDDLAKDEPIYVYCRTGNRAGQAAEILREAGYTDVTNIGGLADWQAAGGPVSA